MRKARQLFKSARAEGAEGRSCVGRTHTAPIILAYFSDIYFSFEIELHIRHHEVISRSGGGIKYANI